MLCGSLLMPENERYQVREQFLSKNHKKTFAIGISLFLNVKCVEEHNGEVHLVLTFIVRPPHLPTLFAIKSLFYKISPDFDPQIGLGNPRKVETPKFLLSTSDEHSHMT